MFDKTTWMSVDLRGRSGESTGMKDWGKLFRTLEQLSHRKMVPFFFGPDVVVVWPVVALSPATDDAPTDLPRPVGVDALVSSAAD